MALRQQFIRRFLHSFNNINTANCSNHLLPQPSASKSDQFENFESRRRFELPLKYDRKDWYPKHMHVQMQVMEGKLRTVDLVLEVHDARVALTGRNSNFAQKLFSVRPHILVMNKKDMIDVDKYSDSIERYHRSTGVQNIVWTDCTKRVDSQWDELRQLMLELLQREHRFNRTVKTEYQVMVIGIPNVGKSSLINSLRKNNLGYNKASAEGPYPGVTVRVQNRVRIWDRPAIYILDTPGVLNPWVHTVDEAMKLSICNLILESSTKPYYVADFLLYFMNKHRDFSYMTPLEMEAPSDDIKQALIHYCKATNLRLKSTAKFAANCLEENNKQRREVWDVYEASTKFLQLFRDGHFVDNFLDRDLLGFLDSSADFCSFSKQRRRGKINRSISN